MKKEIIYYESGSMGFPNSVELLENNKGKILEEGSIIVFPAFMEHRVTPVTRGTRYSLVTWFVGPPFV